MDFNNINDSTIFYLKFLKAIFLTENLTELLKLAENLEIDYKSIDLLKMLRDFVRPQTQKHSLPSNVAENLYTFVNISRFSYTPEDKKERFEISNDIITKLLQAAMSAPSALNEQPWEFIVVDDHELLAKISENGSPLYAKCNKAIIFNKF